MFCPCAECIFFSFLNTQTHTHTHTHTQRYNGQFPKCQIPTGLIMSKAKPPNETHLQLPSGIELLQAIHRFLSVHHRCNTFSLLQNRKILGLIFLGSNLSFPVFTTLQSTLYRVRRKILLHIQIIPFRHSLQFQHTKQCNPPRFV